MSLRNLFRRQTEAPTLRERAAELRASLPSDRPQQTSTSAADSTPAAVQEPVATADPIFDAIAKHVAARATFEKVAPGIDRVARQQRGLDVSDEAMVSARAAWDAANENEVTTWNALFETHPTTLAGVLAVIRHTRKWSSENNGVTNALTLEGVFDAIAEGLAGVMKAEAASSTLVREITAEWAAWGAVVNEVDDSTDSTATWDRADTKRDHLLHAAMALPATPENIAAKAIACAWMEWVSVERPGQPRDAYGPADQLVYDIHATIMRRGIETASPAVGDDAAGAAHDEAMPPADLADACLWAVQHRAWIDHGLVEEGDWSDERFDTESDKVNAVFTRAISEPSANLREIVAKAALALEDFERFTVNISGKLDDGDRIVHTVLREVAALADTVAVPEFRGIDFGPDTHIAELAAEFCRVYARHAVKDCAHMAGDITEAEWDPSYRATVALMERLEATRPKTLLGTALKSLGAIGMAGWNARADGSTDGMDPWERVGVQFQDALMADALAPISIAGPDLVGLVNFQAASMDELHAVYDMANEVSAFAYALVSTGRGSVQDRHSYDGRLTPAGNLMLWVAEALSSVEDAAYNEIKRRKPANRQDQETRLRVLASLLIANGDKAETADFAREILAFAER